MTTSRRFLLCATASFAVFFAGSASSFGAGTGTAEEVIPARKAGDVITVSEVSFKDGRVSGTIVNKTANAVQDVRLLVRQPFSWKNERRPGKVNPGRTLPYTVSGSIPAGGSLPFSFDLPPLPKASGGTFKTTAEVAGFAELVPVSQSASNGR